MSYKTNRIAMKLLTVENASIIEAFAYVLAREAKWHKSQMSMLVCSLATELRNFMSEEAVNQLFDDFQRYQRRNV